MKIMTPMIQQWIMENEEDITLNGKNMATNPLQFPNYNILDKEDEDASDLSLLSTVSILYDKVEPTKIKEEINAMEECKQRFWNYHHYIKNERNINEKINLNQMIYQNVNENEKQTKRQIINHIPVQVPMQVQTRPVIVDCINTSPSPAPKINYEISNGNINYNNTILTNETTGKNIQQQTPIALPMKLPLLTEKNVYLNQNNNNGIINQKRKGSLPPTCSERSIQNGIVRFRCKKDKVKPRKWTYEEDCILKQTVSQCGEKNWKEISKYIQGRNHTQCLQRWTKVLKPGLVKGHWTTEEDNILKVFVGHMMWNDVKNWGQIAARIPGRTSKQCRERWYNHLDPNINKGPYTLEEDRIILEMQKKLGNRWSIISERLNGRTEDAVKIRWKSLQRATKRRTSDYTDTQENNVTTINDTRLAQEPPSPHLAETLYPNQRQDQNQKEHTGHWLARSRLNNKESFYPANVLNNVSVHAESRFRALFKELESADIIENQQQHYTIDGISGFNPEIKNQISPVNEKILNSDKSNFLRDRLMASCTSETCDKS